MARGKDSKAFLIESVERIRKKTEKDYARVRAKRAARRLSQQTEKPETSEFAEPKAKVFGKVSLPEAALSRKPRPGQTGSNVINWYYVQDWFIRGILKNNPDWLVVQPDDRWNSTTQTMWAWREKACAERLLKHYGPDVVKNTVAWFCDNWQEIKNASNSRLGGAPSVRLLWSARERFFAEAKEGKTYEGGLSNRRKKKRKHMVGEYDADADSKMPDIGWGDV